MQAAIYARVSTLHQERDQTIESQLAELTHWCEQQRHALKPEHIFRDEGYSGAYLDRPGLDRLRDAARAGEFDVVAILTPDRLARKYAYQVLVLEELRRAGCETVFVQRPISEDPNDQLLLQIQGAIAEYERAVLGERFRRGKWQQARNGHYTFGRGPYGYRYIPKQEGARGHLVVDETEAELVRLVYRWLLDECLSIRQILQRLNAGPWFPRSGQHPWSPSVVHHILADPIYTGTAYVNRFRFVPAKRPRRPLRPGASEHACRQPRPREEWIAIPVPAIVDQSTFDRAQEQLARNAARSWRNNTKYAYLLRCLLTCQHCGLAMFGVTYPATATLPARRYYICAGKDHVRSVRAQPCPRRRVKAEELETAVWTHIRALLEDPTRLLRQFEQTAQAALDGDAQEQAAMQRLQGRLDRVTREERRLLDAYQAELLSLEELGERRRALALRREALVQEREQALHLRQDRAHAHAVLHDLTAYCKRICSRLHAATLQEQQAILQLLVERIIVGDDTIEVRHVIPLPPASADTADSRETGEANGADTSGNHSGVDPPIRGLRSERVNDTTYVTRQRNMPKVATSPCRFLPLLPPITPNVKLPIPANRLEFGCRARSSHDTPSKSGKNGNVHYSSQHCRQGLPPAFMPGRVVSIRHRFPVRVSIRHRSPVRAGGFRGGMPSRRGFTRRLAASPANPSALPPFPGERCGVEGAAFPRGIIPMIPVDVAAAPRQPHPLTLAQR